MAVLVKDEIWSIVLRFFLKPFWKSTILLFSSDHNESLIFISELYSLYIDDASDIPLYDRGSLGSAVLVLGIVVIIFLPQDVGIFPVSKQTLNKTCKNKTDVSFFSSTIYL